MCGIAGLTGAFEETGAGAVAAMLREIVHRGPDDSGLFAAPGIALGMRRLSIIDLADGHQPMTSPSGCKIVFNGEIYNFRDLRRELEAGGQAFATRSDTEVILRGYETWGLDIIDRLVGMFAIALYDPRTQALHLVRDRLGKKPLYVGRVGDGWAFASELKALRAIPGAPRPEIDRQALYDYLAFRFVPQPRTIWSGITKLPPGHRLTIDLRNGSATQHRYWHVDVESAASSPKPTPGKTFEHLFLDAVRCRLEAADVPVGILLSGGLDSSAVAAAANEVGHHALMSFGIGFADGGRYSELEHARTVAAHLGTRHHDITITRQDFLDALPTVVARSDEPLADLASIPLYYVCKLAVGHVKVVLSGEGADEVLAGYHFDQTAASLHRLRQASQLPLGLLRLVDRVAKIPALTALVNAGWAGYPAERGIFISKDWEEPALRRLWRGRPPERDAATLLAEWYAAAPSAHPLERMLQVAMGDWLVEDLLMKADKMSMAASLELRTPFLDHRLVEWAVRQTPEWKVGRPGAWTTKRLLRDFARRRLPASILDRPKQGFPVPAYGWLADGLESWASERLLDGGRLEDVCDRAVVAETVAAAGQGDLTAQRRTWNLLVLDHWLEAWA